MAIFGDNYKHVVAHHKSSEALNISSGHCRRSNLDLLYSKCCHKIRSIQCLMQYKYEVNIDNNIGQVTYSSVQPNGNSVRRYLAPDSARALILMSVRWWEHHFHGNNDFHIQFLILRPNPKLFIKRYDKKRYVYIHMHSEGQRWRLWLTCWLHMLWICT